MNASSGGLGFGSASGGSQGRGKAGRSGDGICPAAAAVLRLLCIVCEIANMKISTLV